MKPKTDFMKSEIVDLKQLIVGELNDIKFMIEVAPLPRKNKTDFNKKLNEIKRKIQKWGK